VSRARPLVLVRRDARRALVGIAHEGGAGPYTLATLVPVTGPRGWALIEAEGRDSSGNTIEPYESDFLEVPLRQEEIKNQGR